MKGRPARSVASRARKGSTASTPGTPARKGRISGGRSPTRPLPRPACALIQRSDRSVDSTQTRRVSRSDATVTIIASVIPSAIASAATAMAFRATAPPMKPAASLPGGPKHRASGRAARAETAATSNGAANARAATTRATAANPAKGNPAIGPARDRAAAVRSERIAAAPRVLRRPARTASTEPARNAGEGGTRVASAAGQSAAASDAASPTVAARTAAPP